MDPRARSGNYSQPSTHVCLQPVQSLHFASIVKLNSEPTSCCSSRVWDFHPNLDKVKHVTLKPYLSTRPGPLNGPSGCNSEPKDWSRRSCSHIFGRASFTTTVPCGTCRQSFSATSKLNLCWISFRVWSPMFWILPTT